MLDDQDADARTVVSGHDGVELTLSDVMFDSLQTDPPWDAEADPDGYNFLHALDVSTHAAFGIAGRRYLVEYRLTPTAGQEILARFRINAI